MTDVDCVLHFSSTEEDDDNSHPTSSRRKGRGYQAICRVLKQRLSTATSSSYLPMPPHDAITVQVLYDNLQGERQCLDILCTAKKGSTASSPFTASLQIDQQQISVRSRLFFDDFTITFSKPAFQQLLQHYPQDKRTFQAIEANHFYAQKKSKLASEESVTSNKIPPLLVSKERIFEIFTRQEGAFVYFDQALPSMLHNHCKVFTYESVQTGKRHFLVADLHSFCKEYFQQILPHQRHVYEIIREGFPCRLYFDLEFKYRPDEEDLPQSPYNNSQVDGNMLTKKWIQLVMWKLYEVYNVAISWEDVVVLDSTTASKFSKHVTFQLRQPHLGVEYLFPNNVDLNFVIKSILVDISLPCTASISDSSATTVVFAIDGKYRSPRKDFEDMWLYTSSTPSDGVTSAVLPNRSFFVDTGVYTRNRAFRLFSSCKFGKKQSFQLLEEDKMVYGAHVFTNTRHSVLEKLTDILLKTLVIPHDVLIPSDQQQEALEVGNVDPPLEVMSCRDFQAFVKYFNAEKYEILPSFVDAISKLKINTNMLVAKSWHLDCSKLQSRAHFSLYHSHHQDGADLQQGQPSRFATPNASNRTIAQSPYPKAASWFPSLDEFINKYASHRGSEPTAAHIYTWIILLTRDHPHFPVYSIRFTIKNNRYCERVQRCHKSNSIFLEVNLMSQEVYQGCWDYDCRGFRSQPPLQLPPNLLPSPPEILELIQQKRSTTT